MDQPKSADGRGDLRHDGRVLNSKSTGLRQIWLVCLLLAVAVLAAYWPALNCDFVQFDDPDYVLANPHIQNGLSWPVVAWALRAGYAANWHPGDLAVTRAGCETFRPQPQGPSRHEHCLASGQFHSAFSALATTDRRALAKRGCRRSFFALHPLHVESRGVGFRNARTS